MQITEALDKFVMQLRANGRSEHTIAQYQRHVRLFGNWLRDARLDGVDDETLAIFLAGPIAKLRADGTPKRATSVNALRTSLRCFFAYLHGAGLLEANPARLIRRARCGNPPPRGLGKADQERLREVLQRDAPGSRDQMMFELLLDTGIRVGSVVALRVEDVDLEEGFLVLGSTKGDAPTRLPIGPRSVERLSAHLDGVIPGPLFPGRSGSHLTTRHVARRLRHWCQRAGIKRSCSPHSLRHSFAQGLYDRTGDLGLVQRALCHASVASTLVYARTSDASLRAALA